MAYYKSAIRYSMFDEAIPSHLQKERTLPVKTPPNHQPPFPAYVARFSQDAPGFVLAVIGAQFPGTSVPDNAFRTKLESFLLSECPSVVEWASSSDSKGLYNIALLAYWSSSAVYDKWLVDSGFWTWWESLDPATQSHGWFLEVFRCPLNRFETIFSDGNVPEGAAKMWTHFSGPVQEHHYWGAMRDRLPASQTDELKSAEFEPDESTRSGRVRVPGRQNLAVIRSGQDWGDTIDEERQLYLTTMQPVLKAGMDFLHRDGEEVGCISCRYMDIIDPTTFKADRSRTFGLAYFRDLASLENWSKNHPSHLKIFGTFSKYASQLQGNISLRLFHEVFVLSKEDQYFEYIGCHPGTGMSSC
ncbi:hypothetical protein CP533_2045 [Ophiocordyceps camponoti-saundersi (nom. inval.)]|nr:hypothetical protein CP533_2045 [Ophiocordyceps camponoti-saundersi (nom. inval.)]